MTQIELHPSFKTVSGRPLSLGTGTGTKWKDLKRDDLSAARQIVDQVKLSLNSGFYHIDTAEVYETEPEVGSAVTESGIDRADLWLTTKYSPFTETSGPVEALNNSLERLKTDYIDLYLIHVNRFEKSKNGLDLTGVWEQFIEAKKSGKARYIGVSNFSVDSLKTVIEVSKKYGDEFLPVVNQIEFHPYLKNQFPGVYDFCQENNILIEAYGPLTPLLRVKEEHPLTKILAELGKKYNKTDAQLLLRYTLQKNVLPVTTSGQETRIKQSLDVFDFALDDADFNAIDTVEDQFKFQAFTFVNN